MLTVTKRLADGTADTSATDAITMRYAGGTMLTVAGTMTAGVALFLWYPGIEGGPVTFQATSDQAGVDDGTLALWQQNSLAYDYGNRKPSGINFSFFLPGELTPTGGPNGDGIYAQFLVPTKATESFSWPTQFAITQASAWCHTMPTLGNLVLKVYGLTSGKSYQLLVTDGTYYISHEPPSAYPGDPVVAAFTPGETVAIQVIDGYGAGDVQVQLSCL